MAGPLPELTVLWKDLAPFMQQSEAPAYFLERPLLHGDDKKGGVFNQAEVVRVGEFWVPNKHVIDPSCTWAVTKLGDAVRIPVLGYQTQNLTEAAVLATGMHVAIAAYMGVMRAQQVLPLATYIVLGHQCVDLRPSVEAYRCCVGVCFRVK